MSAGIGGSIGVGLAGLGQGLGSDFRPSLNLTFTSVSAGGSPTVVCRREDSIADIFANLLARLKIDPEVRQFLMEAEDAFADADFVRAIEQATFAFLRAKGLAVRFLIRCLIDRLRLNPRTAPPDEKPPEELDPPIPTTLDIGGAPTPISAAMPCQVCDGLVKL